MTLARVFTILVVALLSAAVFPDSGFTALDSQQDSTASQDSDDVIRTTTNLVQLDAVVVDDKGHQVKGLTAADFKIVDKGRELVPEFVSYVSLERPSEKGAPISGHPSSEQLGRVFVFVVSNPVIHFSYIAPIIAGRPPASGSGSNLPFAIRAADSTQSFLKWFVETQMTNADLAAIASAETDLGVLSSFTNDRMVLSAAMKRLREAVKSPTLKLIAIGTDTSLAPLVQLNLRVMETVENVIDQVRVLPGRKVVTLIGGGLLYNPSLPYSQIITERLERLIKKANEARISIYTLHTRDLTVNSRSFGNDGLIHLAHQTGGRAIYNTNDLRVEFDRVIEENRGYYLLSYNPGSEVAQRPSGMQVRVTRRGAEVLARSEGQVQKTAKAKNQLTANPFASPLSSNDVGLKISTALTRSDQVTTTCRIDLSDVATRLLEDGQHSFSLELSILITGPDGREYKRLDRDVLFSVASDELEKAKREGVLSNFTFNGDKPGFYRISVAVRDSHSGKIGNTRVFLEIDKKTGGGN